MTEALKPCPFCGENPKYYLDENQLNAIIECNHCYFQFGAFQTLEDAIEAWNKRV